MKKVLIISAVAALGLSSIASAGGLMEEMPMAPMAMSSDAGFYLGLSGGWGLTNWKSMEYDESRQVSADNGAVGRAFLGYDFNRYFAIEGGYTYFFNKAKFETGVGVETNNVKTSAIDLMGKIKAPVDDNVDLYAKLGANYLMSKFDNVTIGVASLPLDSQTANNFNVAFGAGIDWMITPNVIANVEWLRFNGHQRVMNSSGKITYQPHTDMFMVGLRYKFDM